MRLGRLSLLWKIWLSTSVALTALFGVVGFVLERHVATATLNSLQEEVQTSFRARVRSCTTSATRWRLFTAGPK